MFDLTGKTAIVTGASKGIGKAIAYGFGKAGANVVISSRNQQNLDEVVAEFAKEGIKAIAVAAHASNKSDSEHLISQTISTFGSIDILVNNAAANPHFGGLETMEDWAYQKIMDVNVKGPFELAKLALPEMKKRNSGSIINISSVEGLTPSHGLGIYSVSKAALIMLTKSMAKEWGQFGVRANAICPGIIQTKFSEALWSNAAQTKEMLSKVSIKRVGQPHDLAGLAVFLASDASSYSTGGIFTVDGGYLI